MDESSDLIVRKNANEFEGTRRTNLRRQKQLANDRCNKQSHRWAHAQVSVLARDSGFEPLAFGFGEAQKPIVTGHKSSQTMVARKMFIVWAPTYSLGAKSAVPVTSEMAVTVAANIVLPGTAELA